MKKQLQLILSVHFMVVAGLTGYGQQVGDTFTVDDIQYKITSTTEVEVVDYTFTTTSDVTIPPTAMDNSSNTNYTVTAIGAGAFKEKQLTGVEIPNTVTRIDSIAFKDNPNLVLVTVKANDPADTPCRCLSRARP